MKTVADELNNQWHKIAAIIMKKLGKEDLFISLDDVKAIEGYDIVVEADKAGVQGLYLNLVKTLKTDKRTIHSYGRVFEVWRMDGAKLSHEDETLITKHIHSEKDIRWDFSLQDMVAQFKRKL